MKQNPIICGAVLAFGDQIWFSCPKNKAVIIVYRIFTDIELLKIVYLDEDLLKMVYVGAV